MRYFVSLKWLTYAEEYVEVPQSLDFKPRLLLGRCIERALKISCRIQIVSEIEAQVPLSDVSAKIRELLTEQKVSEMLVSWLQTLRSQGDVHLPGVASAGDSGVQSR